MENYEKYENKIPYPKKRDFVTYYGYGGGKLLFSSKEKLKTIEGVKVWEEEFDEEGFRSAIIEFRKEESKMAELFKNDLFEEYGVSDHPKKEDVYRLAYEYGHSGGKHSVENYFSEFVELILD